MEILYCLIGTFLGIFLGLIPGLHINNILPILISLNFLLSSHQISVFIISLAIAQTFTSYIPSVFLGAPEENTALAVLPGHRMLLEGRGYEAIKLLVYGGILSLILSLILIVIFANFFKILYNFSRTFVHFVIIFFILTMIFLEKSFAKKVFATLIFILSGIFGILVLNSSLVSQQNVLFPTLAGLFGISTLLVSLNQNSKIPEQKYSEIKISRKEMIKEVFLGSVGGILVGFLPAIGVSQLAALIQFGKSVEKFLLTFSSIVVANEVFSLVSLYLVGNPRSGASVAIQRILPEMLFWDLLLFIGAICFSAGISSQITLTLSKKILKAILKLNYKLLNFMIISLILIITFLISGIGGILIIFTAISIGIFCISLGIRRSHCMGVLLVPSLLFFTGLTPKVISLLGI